MAIGKQRRTFISYFRVNKEFAMKNFDKGVESSKQLLTNLINEDTPFSEN